MHTALNAVRAEATAVIPPGPPAAVTLCRTGYDVAAMSMTAQFLLGIEQSRRYSEPVSIRLR